MDDEHRAVLQSLLDKAASQTAPLEASIDAAEDRLLQVEREFRRMPKLRRRCALSPAVATRQKIKNRITTVTAANAIKSTYRLMLLQQIDLVNQLMALKNANRYGNWNQRAILNEVKSYMPAGNVTFDLECAGIQRKETDEYAVSAIITHRYFGGQLQFLVAWEGFSEFDATWEPASALECDRLMRQYQRANNIA